MKNYETSLFAIMFNGSPLLVTPIGEEPTSTFLVDLEEFFILLEKHSDTDGVVFWTEFGKGVTALSNDLGKVIEEKNRSAYKYQ